MKFRLHPILLPLFLFLLVSGNISTYTLIFLSLLIHELGHLIAAWATGMRVRSCTIMPYGGELIIPGRHTARRKHQFYVALGGPIATTILLIAVMFVSFPGAELLIRIQFTLLALNLLPILPLDGGQIIHLLLEEEYAHFQVRKNLLLFSISVCTIALIYLSISFPTTLPYALLTLFLLIQNIAAYRFRRYEKAFLNLKIKELTK